MGEREWAILANDADVLCLVSVVPRATGPGGSERCGADSLVPCLREVIVAELRSWGARDTYHLASEAFQELALSLVRRAPANDAVIDAPSYLYIACVNAVRTVVRRERSVTVRRDADGNPRFVPRRRALPPEALAELEDTRGDDEKLRRRKEALAGALLDMLPPPDRELYRRYVRCGSRRRFFEQHRDRLAELGIDTHPKLGHWCSSVLRAIRDNLDRVAELQPDE